MEEKMTDKQVDQLLVQLKAKLGNSLTTYAQEGDIYYKKGDFATAAAIYNLAAEIALKDKDNNTEITEIHEKRLDAIEKWLKSE